MRKTGILAALLLLGVSQVAQAGNQGGVVSFSPVVGGYTFDNRQNKDTGVVIGGRGGYNITDHIGVEALIDYTKARGNSGTADHDFMRYGGELLYHFFPKNDLVPYLAAGVGGVTREQAGGGHRLSFDYGAGLKYFINNDFALRADVRGINYKYEKFYTNVEYTLGFYIPFNASKPAPAPVAVPAPVVEAAAPKAAPVVVVPPAPLANLAANPASVEVGKSVMLSWDSQNATACEIQPGVGPVNLQGSKEVTPTADTAYTLSCKGDGGVVSSKAPVTVTMPPKVEEAAGKKASAVAAGARLALKVQFDTGKSIIKKQYYDELKVVGDGLNEHKNLKGVIEGHTDSVGSDASNKALSQRRANAVRDYIVKNFKINRNRLAAKGYGESRPIADNATVEGRAQNRRIEATFEEIPNFKPDAEEQPVKKVVKKKAVKKQAPAKKP